MEDLIIDAYKKAKTKELHTITMILERSLKRKFSPVDPRRQQVTVPYVRQILAQKGLSYTIVSASVFDTQSGLPLS